MRISSSASVFTLSLDEFRNIYYVYID